MVDLLGSNSLDGLRSLIDTRRREVDALALKGQLATVAIELLRREEDDILASCPICGNDHDRERLKSALQANSVTGREQELVGLREAEQILQKAERLGSEIEQKERETNKLERELTATMVEIDGMAEESAGRLDEALLETELATTLDKKVSIKAQLDDQQVWVNELDKELSGLRTEARYGCKGRSAFEWTCPAKASMPRLPNS